MHELQKTYASRCPCGRHALRAVAQDCDLYNWYACDELYLKIVDTRRAGKVHDELERVRSSVGLLWPKEASGRPDHGGPTISSLPG